MISTLAAAAAAWGRGISNTYLGYGMGIFGHDVS